VQIYIVPSHHEKFGNYLDLSDTKLLKQEAWKSSRLIDWKIKELLKDTTKSAVASGRWPRFEILLVLNHSKNLGTAQLKEVLNWIAPLEEKDRSLTGPEFSGKKFYLGFGDYLSGFMGNEEIYDIAHTHDVFTSEAGGDYEGVKLHGPKTGKKDVIAEWEALRKIITEKDMYLQYSSGHGSKTGLISGPSYKEIRDNALSYPAKEIIIFTMSCYSGNLVEVFNQKKSEWQNWAEQGKTLMVMASSRPGEESSTGPGKDPDEPGGPAGSAGSAFGHALGKALIGYSDGEIDGINDGFLSLGEIRDYTKRRTQKLGGHTPVVTGVYADHLLMAKTPSAEWLKVQSNQSTEGLTDEEIMEKIRELNI